MSVPLRIGNGLRMLGFNPRQFIATMAAVPRFLHDVRQYRAIEQSPQFPLKLRNLKPILLDYYDQAGTVGGHYFFQDLWVAQQVFKARPSRHVDIGSRLDGFVAHVLTFMEVEVIDIRPLKSEVPGLTFRQADATDLGGIPDSSIESLSSLHAVEHFGLGRYTDQIDPSACFAAMHAMERVIAPGGKFYFSVPVGRERVEFNAHRIFSPGTVLKTFEKMDLSAFVAVDDSGCLQIETRPEDYENRRYSCGIFEFTKPG